MRDWVREQWVRITLVVVAVVAMSVGAAGFERNQNDIQDTQTQSCKRANDTNDGIRNILTYLDQRRQQGSASPLTPEQARIEAHVRALIPPHQDC